MKYERKFIQGSGVDIMNDIAKHNDWRLVSFAFDSNTGLYIAVLEREVE